MPVGVPTSLRVPLLSRFIRLLPINSDVRSLAINPATTTHSQLTPEEQDATGVSDGYVRLSVGIEHIDDIIADIERGLAAAARRAKAA